MPVPGVSRLALLPLLLAAVLAAQAYYNPSVPRNDVLWNGAPAPQQALAVYPYATGADLGCMASGGSLPSAWTFEVLAYHLPTPIYHYYFVGAEGWGTSPFLISFESKGVTVIRYWDNGGGAYIYSMQAVGWKHVLISWDGSTLRYWVNGQLVDSAGITNPRTSFTNIRLLLFYTSDRNRIAPLIVAWVKLWSGAVVSTTQADALARGVTPPGFSLVSGMDYTTWPPRALAGTWDCNGKLFGVPVTRTAGAYVDTAWAEPYSAGRLLAFGFSSSAEIAYAHTPTTAVPNWWSVTAIYYDGASPWPWVGVGNIEQYGGSVVRTNAVNLYATPRGAYAGVLTWVANDGIYYNRTKVASTASNNGVWAPWWRGLSRAAAPSGVSARAVVQYVWVSNSTGTNMPNDAIMVDYRWWPPISSVGFFGTWAHPAQPPLSAGFTAVPGVASGVVSSNTAVWLGGARAVLPPVLVRDYAGNTNNTGLHFGAAYIWQLSSAPSIVSPVAVVPSTYTLAGWLWSAPSTPATGSSLSISFSAAGQTATLYALISAPGAYTFTVGGSATFSIRVTQGYDTICTLSGSGTCNVPPGVALVTVSISSTAATTATVRITYSPPSGSLSLPSVGSWRGICAPLHHPLVYNGLVTNIYTVLSFCAASMPAPMGSVALSTTSIDILADSWHASGLVSSAYGSAVNVESVYATLPSTASYAQTVAIVGRGGVAVATITPNAIYVTTRNVLIMTVADTVGMSVYAPGTQAHVFYGRFPGEASDSLKLIVGDLSVVPTLSTSKMRIVANAPVGSVVRLWSISSGVFVPLGGGVVDGSTMYISTWSSTWLSATLRFLYANPGVYTIYVRNSSTWYYAFTTNLAGQSDVIVRFPYPAPYRIEVWSGATRLLSLETWLDSGSLVYVNTLAGTAQVVALPNRTGGSYVYPLYRISNDPLQPWGYLIYVLTSLSIALYLYRRVSDKGAIAYSAVFDAIVVGVAVYITTASGGQSQYAQLAGLAAVAMLVKIMTAVLPSRI